MIKVMQCIDGLQSGGKERRLVELVKAMRGVDDVEVTLVTLSERVHYEEIRALGIEIHYLKRLFRKDPSILMRLASLARRLQPDVIHAWGSFASVCALPAVKLTGARFVTSMITHAPRPDRLSFQRRLRAALVFPFADIVLANSHAGLASYKAPQAKSLCIHNGFDFERLAHVEPADAVRERLGIHSRWLIGMVASFSANKDYATFVDAAQRLLDAGIDATFLAVGDGPTLASTRMRVARQWRDRVLFPGRVGDVESLVNALDVGVLCTDERLHGEGISNSILEYMAAGKPVVATEGGGTAEIVREGETGLLIPPRNAEETASRLAMLIENTPLRQALGRAGYQRVRKHFHIDTMVKRHIEVYRDLTSDSTAGRA